ncbi:MAG: four helix bundle protein [Deltaproteobacteria bacterium]|nr:four helix bundle protein [Deltaproteobacteria bacterium]
MRLEDLEIYRLSMDVAEKIWSTVIKWDYFSKKTVGDQLVRSADSIAANIAEGYGRFHYQENKHFCYYARGSLLETGTWLTKANNRGLIPEQDYKSLTSSLETIHKKLNSYIRSIGKMTND